MKSKTMKTNTKNKVFWDISRTLFQLKNQNQNTNKTKKKEENINNNNKKKSNFNQNSIFQSRLALETQGHEKRKKRFQAKRNQNQIAPY